MSQPITLEMVQERLNERPPDAHKGTFGHVYVLAGSAGFSGAAKLAGMGAARAGAGLVTIGTPAPLADVLAASLLELMTHALPSTPESSLSALAVHDALTFAATKDAVVLGPGLSQHPETRQFVQLFVQECPTPTVVDADGLNALQGTAALVAQRSAATVLTPHPGEMARLTGLSTHAVQTDRAAAAETFAQDNACILVLKGHNTVVAGPSGEVFTNPTGNAGMATGGTGDILSGIIGGLLAQGVDALDAAIIGVYVHGLAGDVSAAAMTQRAMLAGDLLDFLPEAWHLVTKGE